MNKEQIEKLISDLRTIHANLITERVNSIGIDNSELPFGSSISELGKLTQELYKYLTN